MHGGLDCFGFGVFLCFFQISLVSSDATFANAASILRHLMSNYTKELRPVTNQSEPVVVKVLPLLRSLNSYEEITSALTMTLILTTEWTDENLKWDLNHYGATSIVLPQKNLWKPELFLLTSGGAIEPVGSDNYKIRVFFNGILQWGTGGSITASCAPNLKLFPFDTQICHILFSTLGYTYSEVKFEAIGSNIKIANMTENGAWDITEATFKVYDDKFSLLELTLKLERKTLYYILTLLLPVFCLCILSPMVFALPYSSGERISFCITILLSFAIFMTITGNVIPRVSKPMPMILVFLFSVQIHSGIICCLNILIIRIYNRSDEEEVPRHIRKFVLLMKRRIKLPHRSTKTSVFPKESEIIKTDIVMNESKEAEQKVDQKHREPLPVLWSTVAKTLDSACLIISELMVLVMFLTFIVRII